MRVLLIQPPIQDFYATAQRIYPLGLCSLKAAVQKYLPQIEVRVLDLQSGKSKKTIVLPKELAFLQKFYPDSDHSPFAAFGPYYHFGSSFKQSVQIIKEEKPDLIAISSLFTPYHREVLTLAKLCKETVDCPILIGGPHASACFEQMIQNESIDFVIRAEGERAFVEFLKQYQSDKNWNSVPNLVYKDGGRIFINEIQKNYSLDELFFPDNLDLKLEDYSLRGKSLAFILSSRGCPWKCSFCSVHEIFYEGFRERKVSSIIEEMKDLYKKGVRVFDFEDDNLTFNKKRLLELCESIIKNFPSKDIELVAMNGLSYLALDEERLKAMKEAGFTELNLSLVTSNEDLNKECQRPYSLDHFKKIVLLAYHFGFHIVSYQILGLPGETLESQRETLKFLVELPVLIGASPFYVPPKTIVAEKFSTPTEADLIKARLSVMGPYDDKREEIYTQFSLVRILDFLKGLQFEGKGISLSELQKKNWGNAQIELGFELLEKLFLEGNLYGKNKKGFFLRSKFKKETFGFFWNQINEIRTQRNQTIVNDLKFTF